jgi:uncharacterized membrane protein
MARLRRYAWVATWASLVALLLLQAVDAWQRGAPWIIWLAKLGPMLIFVPGMLGDKLRSYIWVSFVSLGYFILIVERLFAQPGSYQAIGSLVAVVILFIASMLYVRWRARELRALQSQQEPSGELDE